MLVARSRKCGHGRARFSVCLRVRKAALTEEMARGAAAQDDSCLRALCGARAPRRGDAGLQPASERAGGCGQAPPNVDPGRERRWSLNGILSPWACAAETAADWPGSSTKGTGCQHSLNTCVSRLPARTSASNSEESTCAQTLCNAHTRHTRMTPELRCSLSTF